MGAVIAKALEGQLDVVLVHKLRSPFQPEVAIGAVDESGLACMSPLATSMDLDPYDVNHEIRLQMKNLQINLDMRPDGVCKTCEA